MKRARLAALVAGLAIGCGASPPPAPPAVVEPVAAPSATASAAPPASEDTESKRQVRLMLARVAEKRGLPIRREVASRVLDRAQILARIRAHVERETPAEVLQGNGEILAALELIPAEYDFVGGVFHLVQSQIAGYYEPEDQTMYLVDDLGAEETAATLAHELVHALQDQSFPLTRLLKYVPGESDRISAVHALIEGDATSAMFDLVAGSAFNVSENALRHGLAISAATGDASATPRVLQESLTAPYVDGFRFVQALRKRGGWPAVDAAFRAPPETTEQLLHADKYDAREPAVPVAPPPFASLGAGFESTFHDSMGEQGLQIAFAQWSFGYTAQLGAAGWGGDHYVLARRKDPEHPGRATTALGWRMVLDTPRDAVEVAKILESRFGARCRERPSLGPVTWRRKGRDIALAAGPFTREGTKTTSAARCATADAWVQEMLQVAPSKP